MVEPVRERVREREPRDEPRLDPYYEPLIQELRERRRLAERGQVVIRAKELPWHQNRQARVRYYLNPLRPDTALQTMLVFEHIIHRHSGMHRHQGGVAIYVLAGKGYTLIEGERYDWVEEDLLLLPITPGGVAHQHFNLDPGRPARWLAFLVTAFYDYLSMEISQLQDSPQWRPAEGEVEGTAEGPEVVSRRGPEWLAQRRQMEESVASASPNLLDGLFQIRDEYRRQSREGMKVVCGRTLPWEQNRQGKMRWYLHPWKRDTALRNLLAYVQELSPGGCSGRQLCPGGMVHYMLEGQGVVEVDQTRYEWEAGDCVALPIKPFGVEYQFFNRDPQRPARYLMVAPNFCETLGVDLGSAFEQLEDAGV